MELHDEMRATVGVECERVTGVPAAVTTENYSDYSNASPGGK
jgi:hypothetical protein